MKRLWGQALKTVFRLLYHEAAFSYDAVANLVSLGTWWAWGRVSLDFLPPPSAGPILELAHGTGHLQTALVMGGWQAFGLDFSPTMGRIATQRLGRHGLAGRLVRARAQALPFPTGHFSGLVATFPTAYILDPVTLREVARVLRPAGRLVVVPSASLTGGGLYQRAVAAAYRATGQTGAWGDLKTRFGEAGLTWQMESVSLAQSVVAVWVAHKHS
jgi:ubiquinone/menaquinone biosynthesis C-methylase UbiE